MATQAEKIDTILNIVQAIQLDNAARDERDREVKKCVDEHQEILNGNGKPGLKTDIQLLQRNIKVINWIGAIMTGAILADIASRLIQVAYR